MRLTVLLTPLLLLAASLPLLAHDSWVQTNTQLVRVNDIVHVELLLGNHGNEHRDFRLAGKVKLDATTLTLTAPDGASSDLKPTLTDQGLSEAEGFWATRVKATQPGLYTIVHTADAVATYAPKRTVKSSKTFFVASPKLDNVSEKTTGFDRIYGHALELVPLTHPVTPMGPGQLLHVQLLYKGKPLAGQRVAFIPRGVTLADGTDPNYERITDEQGVASFEFRDGNYYLIAAHYEDPSDKGPGYDSTKYSATISLIVPAVCPCCGD
jgi:uncharacterized GH25 family protein